MNTKGMARRRRYCCTVCFAEIMEYPALVENSAQLVCKKCQNERDEPIEDDELEAMAEFERIAELECYQQSIASFFQAVYDHCYTQVSDYLPQPHEYIYGSRNRPISAAWARIPEAHYIQLNHKDNNWIYTWVVTPEQLDRKTVDSYELELVRVPEAVLKAWNELLVTPSHTERVEQTTEPITLTPDGYLDTVLGEPVWMPRLRRMNATYPYGVVVVSTAHKPLIWLQSDLEATYQFASGEVNKPTTKAVVIFYKQYSNKPFLFYLKPTCHKCGVTLTQSNQAAPYQSCNDCQMADLKAKIEQMRAEVAAKLVQA